MKRSRLALILMSLCALGAASVLVAGDPLLAVVVGFWLVVAIAGATLIKLLVVAEVEVAARGRCLRCNYDLTGLDEGPCPECGAAR